ncbi:MULTISPECIES: MFS transporter [unclassified Ensifer]|uniref:MFS transporter n=1 Tax=unclassified Ensifer TaxID=2633371 RepID=UPI000812F10D|nr:MULTISPECIES: MFS transporter [unclassified Ensifer]OCP07149.1 MFS transporter [Ensifer sp. LC11]OCP07732.1 MFS transporter [Ensifer sp. LC13]OCP12106.1 MFS transporter [Ensifer sp. LC14]OCP31817.1 MFS transporter [Ensifer sp. LC499]
MSLHGAKANDFAPDWPAIVAVVLGVTAFSVAQGLTYPLISLSLEGRGVSAGMIGLNAMGFAAGLGAATLLLGRLTRLASADRLIIASLCGCSICLATLAATSELAIWFVARFALGFFVSMVFMLGEAWLNTACPDRLRGRVSGLYGAGMCGGFAAGPLAIPLLGTAGGLGFALLAIYIALVAFLTGLLTMGARTRPEPSSTRDPFAFLAKAPILILMVLMFGFADIAAISAMPVYFVKTGHSQAFAALSVTALAIPTALAQPFIGVLLDRLPRRQVAISAAAVAATGYLLVPFLSSDIALLVTFAFIGAASFALYTAALTMLGEEYRGSMLVAGSAAFSLAYAAGSAAGSGATGALMNFITPVAGPIGVGSVLVIFTLVFAVAGRR